MLGRGAGPLGEWIGPSGEGKVGRGAAGLGRRLGLVSGFGFLFSFSISFPISNLFKTI